MALQEILSQINALYGMEEFKQFCEKLVQTADNMRAMKARSIPLPNLIFAADPGCGVTLHLHLLTELMRTLKLMQFSGEEECFEWELHDEQGGLKRLFLRMRRAAGFYGRFQGIIGLDIGKILEDRNTVPPLRHLMEFMESQKGSVLFVCIIPYHTPSELQRQLVGWFASHSPVELIHMPFPWDEAQYYITDQLFSRGFVVSESAQQALKKAVKTLSGSRDFEGYQTLQILTDEIVWRKVSQLLPPDENITVEDVKFILEDDGYYAAFSAKGNSSARRRVGFGEGEKANDRL